MDSDISETNVFFHNIQKNKMAALTWSEPFNVQLSAKFVSFSCQIYLFFGEAGGAAPLHPPFGS